MTVIIDADACPVTKIAINEAIKRNVPVICVCDTAHVSDYEYAKTVLADLSSKDEPFAFTFLTVDTHFPGGYPCDLCVEYAKKKPYIDYLHL